MASSNCKKREYEDENRNLKPDWKENFAFTIKRVITLCLNCLLRISHYKASKLKHHHEKSQKISRMIFDLDQN